MTKTTITSTRSIEEIVEEYASISDSGALRFHQSRLAYEFVGSTDGKDAADLRDTFRKFANPALARKKEAPLSDPGVTNLVNTWKYMLRANVDLNPETNASVGDVAKAAFNLASQTFRKKEENYVIPAIESIGNGIPADVAFEKAVKELAADKKADGEKKAADRKQKEKEADKAITFDSIAATLGMLTSANVAGFTSEQKSTLRDLLAAASTLVAA